MSLKDYVLAHDLFVKKHGRKPVHFREVRTWVNSDDGQAALAKHGRAFFWADNDDEVAEYEATEAARPFNKMAHSIAAIVGHSDYRDDMRSMIDDWQNSMGGEVPTFIWANEHPAGTLLIDMINAIQAACINPPPIPKPTFRIVPSSDEYNAGARNRDHPGTQK